MQMLYNCQKRVFLLNLCGRSHRPVCEERERGKSSGDVQLRKGREERTIGPDSIIQILGRVADVRVAARCVLTIRKKPRQHQSPFRAEIRRKPSLCKFDESSADWTGSEIRTKSFWQMDPIACITSLFFLPHAARSPLDGFFHARLLVQNRARMRRVRKEMGGAHCGYGRNAD